MPIYEYAPCSGECRVCKGGFTLNRPLSAPPLENCPLCRKPVQNLLKPLSVSKAKNAGLSVFHKVGKGEYERQ